MATTKKEKKRTLFELTGDMLALFDLLDEAEGDTEADGILEQWFTENIESVKDKADGYAAVVREFEYRADVREKEARRLHDSAKAMKNRGRSMKGRLMAAMGWLGIDRIDTDTNNFKICNNGGKQPLDIFNPTLIPAEYTYSVQEIDKDKLRAALEAEVDIPGVVLQERGQHLRIR